MVQSFIGGLPVEDDKKKLKGCHVAVGAPGRVKHLIQSGFLKTEHVKLFVLDEADKLMDQSFQEDINEIFHKLPQKKQVVASSATYPEQLDTFLERYMCCPTYISADADGPLLLGLKQFVSIVKSNTNIVQQLKLKNERLNEILSKVSFTQCLVFTNYQTRAESVSNILNKKGWKSSFISAAQDQTKRLEVVNDLKKFNCRILLSTDLTSRGIDAANVDLVINYDVPYDASTYLHRMGRAGRFGSKGVCITLCSDGRELKEFKHILAVIAGPGASIINLKQIPSDLLNCNCQSSEMIYGEINNTDEIKEASAKVKNSVMELKSKNKINVNTKQKKSKQKNVSECKKDLKLNPATAKELLNDRKEDINTEMSKMDLFSLLQSISGDKKYEPEDRDVGTQTKETEVTATETITTNRNELLEKNIFLYNLTKVLLGQHKDGADVIEEVVASVRNYLKQLEAVDGQRIRELERELRNLSVEEILRNIEKYFCNQKDRHVDDESALEHIFECAYAYACDDRNQHWLSSFSEKEQTEFHEFCNPPPSDSEPDYEDDDNYGDEEDETMESFDQYASEEETVEVIKNEITTPNCAQEQQNPEIADEFSSYFDECGRTLEETALTFEDLESFDKWFYYEWQTEVGNIREYVRQNVYVREMSEFQKNQNCGVDKR